MKILIAVILIIILLFLLAQVYFYFKERNQLRREFRSLTEKSENLVVENEKIKSEIEYYSNPENLERNCAPNSIIKNRRKMMIISP